MGKMVDMSGWDGLFTDETLEEYVNKQGCTLGKDAELLEDLHRCISMCYIHGLATDSQVRQMNQKFVKMFQKALYEIEDDGEVNE